MKQSSMKTNQLIDTSSSCNPCTKVKDSAKSAEKAKENTIWR